MKKYQSLESIKQNVVICKNCNLCNDRKNAVPGKGNQNADIVFIGEAVREAFDPKEFSRLR